MSETTFSFVDRVQAIIEVMRDEPVVTRSGVATTVGIDPDSAPFGMAFTAALEELWKQGICFKTVGRGGKYERLTGDEAAKRMLKQSQTRVRASTRKLARSQRQAMIGPMMTQDAHLKAALERQADRVDLMAAQVQYLQRARKFVG